MDRKKIEVVFSDDVESLIKYNVLPTKALYEKSIKENNKHTFILSSNQKIVIEKSNTGVVTKKIHDSKNTLLIPNYIRFIKRNTFGNVKKLERIEYHEVLEIRWFYNKRQFYTVSHNFMLTFAEINGFRENFLLSPNEYEESIILKYFKKIKSNTINICESPMETEKDLEHVLNYIEKNNSDPRIFINCAKTSDDFVSHRNYKGQSLPAQKIKFKDPLKVNEKYSIENMEILFTSSGFVIEKAVFNYANVINFTVTRDESGLLLNSNGNAYGLGVQNDLDGKYYVKINYGRSFPLEIQHIQLPLIFGTLGQKHNFIKKDKKRRLVPKNVKNYQEFPDFLKEKFKEVYASLLYYFKIEKRAYKTNIKSVVKDHIEETMLEDDLHYVLSLNDERYSEISDKARHNLKIHKDYIEVIEQYNNGILSLIEVNKKISEIAPKIKKMKG